MKKVRGQSLDELIRDSVKAEETRLLYAERRFYLQVAHLVVDLRTKLGISQAELARRAHVSQPLISRIEKGDQRRTPTFDTIHRLLKALGYTLEISVRPRQKQAAKAAVDLFERRRRRSRAIRIVKDHVALRTKAAPHPSLGGSPSERKG